MVKRASFCILADLEVLQSFHTLTYTELEDESFLKFCRARNFSADQQEWQFGESWGRREPRNKKGDFSDYVVV
jgi:hypothetical protein